MGPKKNRSKSDTKLFFFFAKNHFSGQKIFFKKIKKNPKKSTFWEKFLENLQKKMPGKKIFGKKNVLDFERKNFGPFLTLCIFSQN